MRDFCKSKGFISLVTVAAILVIIPVTLGAMGLGDGIKNVVNTALTPVQKLFSYVTDGLGGFSEYFTEFDRLSAENEELRKQLAELKNDLAYADKLEEDYDWLCLFLELKREHTDFVFLSGTVTGRESGNFTTVFTVDRGTAHGVRVGTPAVDATGVIGYVTEAGLNWSKVVTVLSPESSFGGYIERNGEAGLITSDFIIDGDNLLKLEYLGGGSDVREGDRILTTGYGGVYPRGLEVGTVVRVEADPLSQSMIAYIEPSAELTDLKKVMLIIDYEISAITPGTAEATGTADE